MKVVYNVETKKEAPIDLDEIIKSRALFQANSGGGKSYLLRKFLEQSHGKVQQIIIDPEGEFPTLREKYEYILVGKDGADIQIDTRYASLLAKKLMETGANAILDLYEMSTFERIRFVKVFLDALVNLPKSLWHKCIVVIDEIHVFAPESSKGRSESLESVAGLASRGRKRGYALVGATQKLSKFHKDVAAELNTKFTGRCVLDIDQKRAAAELGLKDHTELRKLKYEFYAFGPAISGEVIKVKAYKAETTHEDIGTAKEYKVANKSKIDSILSNFVELPKEAENQLKNEADLRKKINEQSIELAQLKRNKPAQDPGLLQRYHDEGYSKGTQNATREYAKKIKELEFYIKKLQTAFEGISVNANTYAKMKCIKEEKSDNGEFKGGMFNDGKKLLHHTNFPKVTIKQSYPTTGKEVNVTKYASQEFNKSINNMISEDLKLGRCERSIIETLAKFGKPCSKAKIGIFSGYSFTSGGFSNALSKLKTYGLIEYDSGDVTLTEAGLIEVGTIEPFPTDKDEVIRFWINKVGRCAGKILDYLSSVNEATKEEVGEQTGYSSTSGGFSNAISKLRTLSLIDADNGLLKVSSELYTE